MNSSSAKTSGTCSSVCFRALFCDHHGLLPEDAPQVQVLSSRLGRQGRCSNSVDVTDKGSSELCVSVHMDILKPFSYLQHAAAVKFSDSMNIAIADD